MSSILEKQRLAKQGIAKQAIYEAALEVISRPDFEGLKMHDIASAADIATGTLYNYFRNKEDLLYYVDRRLHDDIIQIVGTIIGADNPVNTKFKQVIGAIFDFVGRYHVVFDLAERSGICEMGSQQEKEHLVNRMVNCFEKILDEGVRKGEFKPVNVKKTAMIIFATFIGIFEKHKFLNSYIYSESKADLLEFFINYLKPA